MQPSWALPKLLWLLRAGGGAPVGARLMHQSDFINRHLTGGATATDTSHALKTGAHLINGDWPEGLMAELGVPQRILPPLTRPGTIIGTVGVAAAASTTIPRGTPVIAGMTDGCAAQLGAGVVEVGRWNSVLGTTLVLKGVTRELLHDPSGAVYSHRAPDGHWLPGGASSTGGGAISLEFGGRDVRELDERARAFGPAGIVRYPLVGVGERFPFVAPDARAFSTGAARDDGERYAALLEGVAFIERLAFDHLDMLGAPMDGAIVLTGGATRSDHWCQLRADVLGRPVCVPVNAEPALGMAMLAATSTGEPFGSVAARITRTKLTLEPRRAAGERYRAPYLRLVGELERRGWLSQESAQHARARATR